MWKLELLVVVVVVHGVLFGAARAQTCSCAQSPGGLSDVVEPVGVGVCVTRSVQMTGCVCDLDGPMTCDVSSGAPVYSYTDPPLCIVAGVVDVARCPDVRTLEFGPCEINASVPWSPTLKCTIDASRFPAGATVTQVDAIITQADAFSFSGTATDATDFPTWTVEYETENDILPIGTFLSWPATPKIQRSGAFADANPVLFSDGNALYSTTVAASTSGVALVNSNLASSSDTTFEFVTVPGTFAQNFNEVSFDPITSYARVILSAKYTV